MICVIRCKKYVKSIFNQWRSVTTDKSTLTSIQSVEQRRALMQAFDEERNFLYDLAKNHMVNSEYIYDLFSEILLSESLVLDHKIRLFSFYKVKGEI